MQLLFLTLLLGLTNSLCRASGLGGPFLFWGHKKVETVQPYSLVEGDEQDFENLYKDAKAIVIFVRNNTKARLDSSKFPKLQELIHAQAWSYLPQRALVVEPFNYNSNVEVINLGNSVSNEDEEIVDGFNDAITIYGEGSVLGILANSEDETNAHFISKRQARTKTDEAVSTTQQTPTVEVIEESFTYVAAGGGAVLTANSAPILNISSESYKLVKHQVPAIKFDDQSAKGYGRFTIIFLVDEIKFTLRFNFTISRGFWVLRAVEVDNNKDSKQTLTLAGTVYDLPSAPVGFSYRCGPYPLIFRNEQNSLTINNYQIQPWLNNKTKFGDVFDCVGFTTAPIWAGVLVTLFLCGILSIGLMAIYDIKTPNKFESSRSKQLTFTVQE